MAQNDQPLSLSDAMLEGIRIAPIQLKGEFFSFNGQWAACALGAILLASSTNTSGFYIDTLTRLHPVLRRIFKNPHTGTNEPLLTIIINLNDVWDWSREDIAKWLKTINL